MSLPRVGIVSATGTGRKRTIPALMASTVCKVTAVHGRNKEKIADLARQFNIPHTYTDLSEMIADAKFDVAVVCSPPFLHLEQVTALVNAGVPTLSEKPLALDEKNAKQLKAAAQARSVLVLVAHHLRHQNTYAEIKAAVTAGEIGEVKSAFFEWSFAMNRSTSSAEWKLDPERNGPTTLSDAGIHCIDIAVGLFGAGVVQGVSSATREAGGTFESCDALVLHNGVQVVIRASRLYGPHSNQLLISGTKGEISAPLFFTERSAEQVKITVGDRDRLIERALTNPYQLEVEDFVQAATEPGFISCGTTLDESIDASRILDEVASILRNKARTSI